MNMEIANRLAQYRKKAGLSQEELALKLGVSRQAVSKWECGESSPDTDNLINLSKIYGVSLDELVNGESNKEKEKTTNSIHLEDKEGNKVDINVGGIHIKEDKEEVHIDDNGVNVISDDEQTKFHKDMKDLKNKIKVESKFLILEGIVSSSIGLIVLVTYLLLGFLLPGGEGWRNYWVLFFLIPIVPSIFRAIRKRRVTSLQFPCIVTMLYLSLGMFMGIWHPTWIMFIAIPLFYSFFAPLELRAKQQKNHHHGDVIDNVIDNEEDN